MRCEQDTSRACLAEQSQGCVSPGSLLNSFTLLLPDCPFGVFPAGFVLFLCLGILTMLRPNMYFMAPLQEKVVFGMFFLGAVLCLSFSWLFHTVYCHSEKVSRTFSK